MKKLESSLLNMIVVLVLVAVASGSLLAVVNATTAPNIAKQADMALQQGIADVMGGITGKIENNDISLNIENKDYAFVVHNIRDNSGKLLGAAVESTTNGFGGNLKVLVGFDDKGTVLGYTVLENNETPGLGAKAPQWFQKGGKGNIIGRQMDCAKPLTVSKDGGDVDAITASTITSRAFLKAINQAYQAYAGQTPAPCDGNSGATQQAK